MFTLYIKKAEKFFGLPRTREIHERAIQTLPDDDAKRMCLEFAKLEQKLGEVDRGRAIFSHGSQFADPRLDPGYWQTWRDFEVAFGNEDTFRDMLRVKRSVELAFSQANYIMADASASAPAVSDNQAAAMGAAAQPAAAAGGASVLGKRGADEGGSGETEIAALERQAAKLAEAQALSAATAGGGGGGGDDDEIDLDDEDEDDEGPNDDDLVVGTKAVPKGVFGGGGAEP